MFKTFIYFFFLFLLTLSCETKGQANLVYNGDFEIYDTCPRNVSDIFDLQIEHCLGWTVATWGTSDYYNSCSNNFTYQPIGVPYNAVGYQTPYNGNGYVGGFFYLISDVTGGHYREYIQGSLLSSLQSGKTYEFCMQLSLANSSSISIKNVGVFFSHTKIQQLSSWKPLTNVPDLIINSSSFYNDTLGWIKLSGSFIANGGENYFTIGNFADTLNTDTLRVIAIDPDAPDYSAYYYIDAIKINEKDVNLISSHYCDENHSNIFSPNDDGVNDIFKFSNCKIIAAKVYNRWGIKVFETKELNYYWDGRTTSGELCSEGIYFYIFESEEKEYKGFVQLVR